MKNSQKLSRNELRNIFGGKPQQASCTASCGNSGSSVECDNVTSCIATEGVGCQGTDDSGNTVTQTCKTNVG